MIPLALVGVLLLGAPDRGAAGTPAVPAVRGSDTMWAPLKVGAGGWITGIDACAAGATFALRTDTYGAYVGRPSGGEPWRQIVRADTMPPPFVRRMGDSLGEGVYEIRVAPSDCDRLYMAYGKRIYRSTNRGAAWTETAFAYAGPMDPNDAFRAWGEKMAVDPANPDVVYAGTPGQGLFVSTNGGASWSVVRTVPVATSGAGITGIVFDASSGRIGGRTSTIYATSNGNGVYRSTDAGGTWSPLAGGPSTVTHAAVASDGVYYAVNMGTSVHVYAARGWSTSADSTVQLHSIAVDPSDPARIVAGRDSGHLVISRNRGVSWGSGVIWGPEGVARRTAPDVPWLAFANERYMSNGSMRFDPQVPNKLWFTEGIGVWYSAAPDDTKRTTWSSYSSGIEQLVARDVCVPPGSPSVILAGLDRGVWVVPRDNASYPSRYVTMGSSAPLIAAWSVAFSRADPSHLVAVFNRGLAGEAELSGYSLDGGATWSPFPVQPGPGGQSGDIVAPSVENVVVVVGTKYAYRSTDRGRSWTPLALPGASASEGDRLHCGYNCKKHVLAVDGVDARTIYLYFYTHGVYRSVDGGATWSLVSASAFDGGNMYWQAKLRSVPGRAGHLFLTAGQAGGVGASHPADTHLWRTKDGGTTWARVPGMAEPYDVAIGKAAPGGSYPSIYVVGWYRNAYGIWRSTDDAATWTNIGPFPFDSLDEIVVIAASQDVFGEVYVAFQGSGWGVGRVRAGP
jgi:photosystem II stability/assembly factor-like uncharacterized protein